MAGKEKRRPFILDMDPRADLDLGLDAENTLDFFQSVPGLRDFFDEDVTLQLRAAVERETGKESSQQSVRQGPSDTELLLQSVLGTSPTIANVLPGLPDTKVSDIGVAKGTEDSQEVKRLNEEIKKLQEQVKNLEDEKRALDLERTKKLQFEEQWSMMEGKLEEILGKKVSTTELFELATRNLQEYNDNLKYDNNGKNVLNRLIESRTKLCQCLLQNLGQDEFTQILQGSLDDAEADLQELKRQYAKLKEKSDEQEKIIATRAEQPPEPKKSNITEEMQKMYLGEIERLGKENDEMKREMEILSSKKTQLRTLEEENSSLRSEKVSLEQKLNQLAKFLSTYKKEMMEKINIFRKHSEFLTGWRIDIVGANRISIGLRGNIHDTHSPSLGQILIGLDSSGTYSVLQSPLTDRFPESVTTYLTKKGSIPGLLADILLGTIG